MTGSVVSLVLRDGGDPEAAESVDLRITERPLRGAERVADEGNAHHGRRRSHDADPARGDERRAGRDEREHLLRGMEARVNVLLPGALGDGTGRPEAAEQTAEARGVVKLREHVASGPGDPQHLRERTL